MVACYLCLDDLEVVALGHGSSPATPKTESHGCFCDGRLLSIKWLRASGAGVEHWQWEFRGKAKGFENRGGLGGQCC